MKKSQRGFIALTSVLVLSAIFLSVAISIVIYAVAASDTSLAFDERDRAKYYARGCMEYARMQLQRTLDYGGDEGILIGDGECQISPITESGNTNRTVHVESTVGAHAYRIEDIISAVSPNMVVESSGRVE